MIEIFHNESFQLMRLILLLLIALSISTSALAFETVQEALKYIEKHEFYKAPDGYALPLILCDQSNVSCVLGRANSIRDLKEAYGEDYQAQRNLAYCFLTSCDGGVQINAVLGCAWRIVIAASGSPKIDAGDISNLKHCVDDIGSIKVAIAKGQAARIYKIIYRREIAHDWQ